MTASQPMHYLLEYVDQNRFPRPKFTTSPTSDGMFTSAVEIWDRRRFTSTPFPDRAEAEQAAASRVLYAVYGFTRPLPPPPIQIAPDLTLSGTTPAPGPRLPQKVLPTTTTRTIPPTTPNNQPLLPAAQKQHSSQREQPRSALKTLPTQQPIASTLKVQSPAKPLSTIAPTLSIEDEGAFFFVDTIGNPDQSLQEKSERHVTVVKTLENEVKKNDNNTATTPTTSSSTTFTIPMNNNTSARPLNAAIAQRADRTITAKKRPAELISGSVDGDVDREMHASKHVKNISPGVKENARASAFLLSCDAYLRTEEWKGEKLFRKVDKNSINALPRLKFEGRIRVITTPEDLDKAVEKLYDEPVLGLDTESRPAFEKGTRYPTSLIQLATKDTAYLFPLFAFLGSFGQPVIPTGLCSLLSNPKILKVGAGITEDMTKLANLQHNDLLQPEGIVDLTHLAQRCGIQELGLRGLCALLLGKKLSKTEQLSRWDAVVLSPKQQHYAACDAWVGLRLYEELVKRDIPALEKAQVERQKRRAQVLKEFLAAPSSLADSC